MFILGEEDLSEKTIESIRKKANSIELPSVTFEGASYDLIKSEKSMEEKDKKLDCLNNFESSQNYSFFRKKFNPRQTISKYTILFKKSTALDEPKEEDLIRTSLGIRSISSSGLDLVMKRRTK